MFGLHERLKSHQMALCSKVDSGRHRGGQGVHAGHVEVVVWSVGTRASSQYVPAGLQLLVHNLSVPQMSLHSKAGEDVETMSPCTWGGLQVPPAQPLGEEAPCPTHWAHQMATLFTGCLAFSCCLVGTALPEVLLGQNEQ